MKRLKGPWLVVAAILASVAGGAPLIAQGPPPGGGGGNALVYKLGTFERQGRTFVGIVLRDSVVIDYAVANEDVGQASVVDVSDGKTLYTITVGGEPEGVNLRPDGKVVYVTSEEDGEVFVIDAVTPKL